MGIDRKKMLTSKCLFPCASISLVAFVTRERDKTGKILTNQIKYIPAGTPSRQNCKIQIEIIEKEQFIYSANMDKLARI